MTYTPDFINSLKENEIFVFGSNFQGLHGGGAARIAHKQFGAEWGVGAGPTGQCYAIPTMDEDIHDIRFRVFEFIDYAKEHPHLHFYVTRIGCGIAGFTDKQMAPLFRECLSLSNVSLPKSFCTVLSDEDQPRLIPRAVISHYCGRVRTLIDLAKALNAEKQYTDLEQFAEDFKELYESYMNRSIIDEYSYSIFYRGWMVPTLNSDRPLEINEEELYRFITNDNTQQSILLRRGLTLLLRIIYYLNESQRYTTAQQIQEHLAILFPGLSHCTHSEVKMSDMSMGLVYFFINTHNKICEIWDELLDENGVLSNDKIERFFFTDYANQLEQHGLDELIRQFYQLEYCTSDHYIHQDYFTGPFFLEVPTGGCHSTFAKSCGGSEDTRYPDVFEFDRVKCILESCGKYEEIDYHLVPIEDYSLPVYSEWGKKLFATPTHKYGFIKSIKPNAQINIATCWSEKIDRDYPWNCK